MSYEINCSDITDKDSKVMDKQLFISPISKKKRFQQNTFYVPPKVPFVHRYKDKLYVPYSWGLNYFKTLNNTVHQYKDIDLEFIGTLREEQEELKENSLKLLNDNNTCLIAVYPGFGKTITSLSIISELKKTTLIIVNKIVLVEQWREAIKKFLDMDVFFIKGKNCKIKPSSIYIVNAINLPKFDIDFLKNLGIGCVIVDECHLILTKIFSQALFQICPKYLLGLSATPYRSDGFDTLFNLYFGENRLNKSLYCPHKVINIDSKIPIEFTLAKNGNINWNSVIDSQSFSQERNELICNYIEKYKEKNILVLCKRIKQMNLLNEMLREKNIDSVTFKESDISFDKESKVLISSFQKVGTGFSHDKLDMLILAVDTEEYFLQYLGRVFRRKDSSPIILDIVDDNPVLWKHYRTRAKVYRQCGGTIEKLKIEK